jgi:hypothetical protein
MRTRVVKGTNIRVQALVDVDEAVTAYAPLVSPSLITQWSNAREGLRSLAPDDVIESSWVDRLRPLRALIAPTDAFAQGIKRVGPAINFNTYDATLAKSRRAARRERQQQVTDSRRSATIVSPVALKAPMDPKKLPKESHLGVEAGEEQEVLALLSGKTRKQRTKARRLNRASGAVKKAKRPMPRTTKLYVGENQ